MSPSRFVLPMLIAGLAGLARGAVAADTPPAPATPHWQQTGWGGGAYYFATAWHPTDENVIYLGSDCAGVYRSDDKGQHWRFANNGLRDYAVYSLATSASAPDQVWALTEGGLHKSVDGARSWEFIPDSAADKLDIRSARNGSVQAVAIHPRRADEVYAGSRTGKLFKTEDGGKSWHELDYRAALPAEAPPPAYLGAGALALSYATDTAGMDTMGRASLVIAADAKTRDWSAYQKLSLHLRPPEGAPTLKAALAIQSGGSWTWQQGPWTDAAAGAWSEIALDLANLKGLDAVRMVHVIVCSPNAAWKGEVLVDACCLHADKADTLAAGATPDAAKQLVLADWEKPGDAAGWSANHEFKDSTHIGGVRQSQKPRGAGGVLSAIAIPEDAPETIFVSNTAHGVFKSVDAGATWARVDDLPANHVTVSRAQPRVVWAACGAKGLRRSDDDGKTWTTVASDAFGKAQLREVAAHPTAKDRVYAIGGADWSGSLFHSEDGGRTWAVSNSVRMGMPGDPTLPLEGAGKANGHTPLSSVTNISLNPRNPDELFISGNWRNVFSGDGGRALEERSTGADNTCATDIQFLDGRTYATAMDEGLFVSENDGGEWRQLLPLKYDANTSGHFWRVRVAKVGDATRIVTTNSPWQSFGDPKVVNRAWVSEDGGKSFTLSTAGLPDYIPNVNCMWGRSFPRALALDPSDPLVLYLGMDGDPEPAKKLPGGGIFRSADGGKTWTRCAGQPGGLRLYYGLVVDPTEPKRLFFSSCGTGGGIWRSEDQGATWEHVVSDESWSFNVEVSASGLVLAGGTQLRISADHGKTWKVVTSFAGDPTIVGIATDPADPKRFWISRTTWDSSWRGGIWRTVDGGATWQEITGDIGFRKPQVLRYNPATHTLWACGAPLFKLEQ